MTALYHIENISLPTHTQILPVYEWRKKWVHAIQTPLKFSFGVPEPAWPIKVSCFIVLFLALSHLVSSDQFNARALCTIFYIRSETTIFIGLCKVVPFTSLEDASLATEYFGITRKTSQTFQVFELATNVIVQMAHILFVQEYGSQKDLVCLTHAALLHGRFARKAPKESHKWNLQVHYARLNQRLWSNRWTERFKLPVRMIHARKICKLAPLTTCDRICWDLNKRLCHVDALFCAAGGAAFPCLCIQHCYWFNKKLLWRKGGFCRNSSGMMRVSYRIEQLLLNATVFYLKVWASNCYWYGCQSGVLRALDSGNLLHQFDTLNDLLAWHSAISEFESDRWRYSNGV